MISMDDAVLVFAAALVTALATGLGAVPFTFFSLDGGRWLGRANALAAGVMLGAGLSLLIEGADRSAQRTAIGALVGVLFVHLAQKLLDRVGSPDLGQLTGADARKALLIVAVMTVHSASEGIGVGASFGGGQRLGLVIALAIAVHNIPEGLAISLVLVPRGTRVSTAAGWSVFSSLPQPLLAVPAFVFVEEFSGLLPVGLGFAAGAMIWMLARELVPEAMTQIPKAEVAGVGTAACVGMVVFQSLLTA
jgi:zinc transporter ZupT